MAALSRQLISWTCLLVVTPYLLTTHASERARMQGAPSNASGQEGIVKLADSNIEYFSQGHGESIVLLPFGGLTVGYMQELSQDLADAGYRVVRINFRGSGASTGSEKNVTLHTLADDVAGVIKALKLGKLTSPGMRLAIVWHELWPQITQSWFAASSCLLQVGRSRQTRLENVPYRRFSIPHRPIPTS